MATDERFVLIPYAGVSPTAATIYSVGIDSAESGYKIACSVSSDSHSVVSVYACKVNGSCYCFSEYGSTGYMNIDPATATSKMSSRGISSTYRVPTTSVRIKYDIFQSYYVPNALGTMEGFNTFDEAALAFLAMFPDDYVNISYVGNGCTIGGPPYVETGIGVLVPVTLPVGASLTADNISVTKNGASLDFNYNPQTQQIAFTAI